MKEEKKLVNSTMDRAKIDDILNKMARGIRMAIYNKNDLLIDMGRDILGKLLEATIDNDTDEDMKYLIGQIIIKCPDLTKPLSEIINATYPQFKEYTEKLLVLR